MCINACNIWLVYGKILTVAQKINLGQIFMIKNKRTIIRFGVYFLVFGIFIAATFFSLQVFSAFAGPTDFFRGWIWNDHIGWISMNCVDPGTCPSYDYGVDMDLATGDITGYGWSENGGWVCFGSTCAGVTPEGGGGYAGYSSSTGEMGGWAKMVWGNMPNDGWISLNCANMGLCGLSNYKVTIDTTDNTDVEGWAWNANDLGGAKAGIGWFDFSQVLGTKEFMCDDLVDNDGDGDIDCSDPDCPCLTEKDEVPCTDLIDNDGDGLIDCADNLPDLANSCWHHDPYCPTNEALAWYWDAILGWYQPGGAITCHDGIDNDWDSLVNGAYDANPLTGRDCFDADCAPFCLAEPEICDDGFDNDWDGDVDCADDECAPGCPGLCEFDDSACVGIGEVCYVDPISGAEYYCIAKPWLETQLGNVYSQLGISGPAAPEGEFNATYCVLSTGGIANFTSERDCYLTPGDMFGFPSKLNKYTNILGNVDINGIINGLYGEVVLVDDASDIPTNLNGKIYYSPDNDLDFELGTLTFQNGVGNQSGAGLIIVRGDITFDSDTAYDPGTISKIKNLASVGWIAFYDPISDHGGHIYIGRDVDNLVGAFYGEHEVITMDTDEPLIVHGLMISRSFDFGRTYSSGVQGAERIIFDGRALTNPPPGMEDLTKSLPAISDIVPGL